MSLNSKTLLLPLLIAQTLLGELIAIPILDCADKVTKRGTSLIAVAVPSRSTSIAFTQPVPLNVPIILNPGAANQESILISSYTSTTGPYTGVLQLGPSTFAHAAGEPVTFESQEAAAYFGYFNPFGVTRSSPAGSDTNFIAPGDRLRGQPSDFTVGVHHNFFGVPISTSRDVLWTLGTQMSFGRALPDLACIKPGPVLVAESQTVALGATTTGLRIATVTGGAPGPVTAAVTGVFRHGSSLDGPDPASEVEISNLRVQNGAILADITTSLAATFRHFFFILRVTDSAGRRALSSAYVDVVNTCPMTVSPSVLTTAFVNTPYTANFTATGAPAPITFAIEGSLPAGLGVSESGLLSGTPLQTGTFPLTLRSTAADGCFYRTPLSLEVQGQLCSANVTPLTEITLGGFRQNLVTRRFQQTVTIRNTGQSSIFGPMALVADNLSANATLATANGTTTCAAPLGRPYALAELGPNNLLAPGATASLNLEFTNTAPASPITYTPRILAGGAIR